MRSDHPMSSDGLEVYVSVHVKYKKIISSSLEMIDFEEDHKSIKIKQNIHSPHSKDASTFSTHWGNTLSWSHGNTRNGKNSFFMKFSIVCN